MADKKVYELWSGTKGWDYCYNYGLNNQSIPSGGKDGWYGYITFVPDFNTLASAYYAAQTDSDISSLITIPNPNVPYQLFTLPVDSTVEFSVIGASGGYCSLGLSGPNGLNPETGERLLRSGGSAIALGGRGAKIVASGKFKAGTKFLCGIGLMGFGYGNSTSTLTPTLQGSGGGASFVLLVDDAGLYPVPGTSGVSKVTPLVVAGGGGGSAGAKAGVDCDGGDAILADGDDVNGGVKLQTEPPYEVYAGTGGGLTGTGTYVAYYSTNLTAHGITYGYKSVSSAIQSRAGGWPNGGGTGWSSSTINNLSNIQKEKSGSGGGGGYSGGNVNNKNGLGGTSYVNTNYLKVVSRSYPTYADGGFHPQCRPGGLTITLGGGRDESKLIIAMDSQGYKYFDGVVLGEEEDEANPKPNVWKPIPVQTTPEPETYQQYGNTEITSFNGLEQNARLLMMHSSANDTINIDAYVNHAILKQTKPVSVSDVSEFTNLTANSTPNGVDIRFAFSKDQGLTWQTYQIGGTWANIDIADRDTFMTDGFPLASMNTIPITDFNNYNPKTIMAAFCITQNDASSGSILKGLSYIANLVGSWRHYKEDEAEYEYISDTELRVKFLKNGNYKVNYLDSLSS